jgi:YD repeat-containing protein
MSKVTQSGLRGSVKTMRTEFAEWDVGKEEWQAPRHTTLHQFHAHGQINESVSHNPNGSVSRSTYTYDAADRLAEVHFRLDDGPVSKTVYRYDDLGRAVQTIAVDGDGTERETAIWNYDNAGRKTKIEFVLESRGGTACSTAYGIEGTEQSYFAEGVATITTLFDDREHPSEALLHDSRGGLILEVTFTRDNAGRLLCEEARWPAMPASIEKRMENAPPEERAAAAAIFAQVLGPEKVLSRTTYSYDERGRRIERSESMGGMSADHITWHYDDYDNPIRQIEEHKSHDMNVDESGNLQPSNEKSSRHEVRFDYKYDKNGNWTERVVTVRYESNPDFQRSNIERREITYYV